MIAAAGLPAFAQTAPFDSYVHTPSHYAAKARAGDPAAQFYLGLALERLGPKAEARWGKASDWIASAALAGHPDAVLRQAQRAFDAGDLGAARAGFRTAAAAGDPVAQFNLGRLAQQDGDLATARRAYRQAARQGHGPARFNLALALLETGERPALPTALAWLTLAAEDGVANAAAARDALGAEATEDEREAASKMAGAWR